jgi:hypothetical protein
MGDDHQKIEAAKKELEAALLEVRKRKSEAIQEFITVSLEILESFKKDIKEIDVLQGRQRKVRKKELKDDLFEHLIANSIYAKNLPRRYFDIFGEELKSIYNFE